MSEPAPTPLLLDTHIWVWLLNGHERLQRSKARERIEHAGAAGLLRVSIISVWEVAMLEAKNRVSFPTDCLSWVRQALARPGLSLVEISPEIAIASSRLPGTVHGDPADRILIATARALDATLATCDAPILRYGEQKHVRTLRV